MLADVFGFRLELTPIGGYCAVFTPSDTCGGPVRWAHHLLLPWIAFGLVFAAIYARMIRANRIGYGSQASKARSKWPRGRAPTTVALGSPPANRITVGSERTP